MSADLQELEARLGHVFSDRDLLVRALTHRSLIADQKSGAASTAVDNEQLEFLGDSILGFLVSEWLLRSYPEQREGRLSKLKHHLVSATRLHEVALSLGLGEFLKLGKGEELSGGRTKKSLLANALEAVIAAVYLDGGLEAARRLVVEQVIGRIASTHLDSELFNYKELEERTKAMRLPGPQYAVVEESGPGHARTFVVEARVGDLLNLGTGTSKKAAEQGAAKGILEMLDAAPSEASGLGLEVEYKTRAD